MNMDFLRKLAIPMEVKGMYPLTEQIAQTVAERDKEIKAILSGKDDRLLLVIGPCSADNEDSVLDYIVRLARVQEKVADRLLIVPRLYTTKPRTTADGYMGMLHQPDPTGKPDLFAGLIAIRKLHTRAIAESGLTCADELLYPENYKYHDDLIGYVAVGARSVEDQQHRLTASGIDVPVGMKNPTGGSLSVMLNAIRAAQHGHTFLYRGWEARSKGNPYAHAVLRGYTDERGGQTPNYRYEDLTALAALYAEGEYENPAVIVDTNHANSGKNPFEQPRIAIDVLASRRKNNDIRRMVKGFMIESYIEDGAQPIGGGVYGRSITDPCLGWEKSERLIYDIAGQA